jgi:uncharacterized Fe-S cluster-containing radical SAM superfamily protein
MTEFNKSFCVLPWMHFHVGPQGLNSLCCDANEYEINFGFIDEEDPLKGFNSEKMRDVRTAMLAGVEVKGCGRCYENEKNGIRSAREYYNTQVFPQEAQYYSRAQSTESVGIASIDFRADNSCNMKCRTCSPLYSSALAAEERALSTTPLPPEKVALSIMKTLDTIDFKKIKRLYFAGGEPLLAREHYKFLKYLIAEGLTDIELVYTTNVSRFAHNQYEILQIWSSFKRVILGLSLDSWGPRAEYIRTGQHWEQTLIDVKTAKKLLPHAYIFASTTISVFNLLTLPEFIENLVGTGCFNRQNFHLHMVYEPSELRIDSMGEDFRRVGNKVLNQYIATLGLLGENDLRDKIVGIQHSLNNDQATNKVQEFLDFSQKKDVLRGTSLWETFPELDVLRERK